MEIVKRHLKKGQYLTHQFEKKSIFLHHTESLTAQSALNWWDQTPTRVGTPYVIDRDSTIYEAFDPSMWAFHLGVTGDDNFHEKQSINIEIVSAGHLHYVNKKFMFYPLWPKTIAGVEIPKLEVFELSKPWRGEKFFHKYNNEQIAFLCWLIKDIVLRFPAIKLQESLKGFYNYNEEVLTDHLPGLWSHSTVRKDKKDIYPDPLLLESLKSLHKEIKEISKPTQIKEVKVIGKKGTKKKT